MVSFKGLLKPLCLTYMYLTIQQIGLTIQRRRRRPGNVMIRFSISTIAWTASEFLNLRHPFMCPL